jgi:adenosine deaminase
VTRNIFSLINRQIPGVCGLFPLHDEFPEIPGRHLSVSGLEDWQQSCETGRGTENGCEAAGMTVDSMKPLDAVGLRIPPEGVVEQHVHLGGAVPIHRLFEAAVDRGIRLPVTGYEEFSDLLHRRKENSGTLEKYLEIYEVAERIQSGPGALRESVLIALNGAARTQGAMRVTSDGEAVVPAKAQLPIRALELRFNPMKRNSGGIWDLDRVMLAACSGVSEVRTAYKGRLRAGLIVCLGRDMPHDQNRILAEKVALWSKDGLPVIGIDLAGPESANTLSDPRELDKMAELFALAGDRVGRTVHCGETEAIDLETFMATMSALNADRVGHPLVVARAYWQNGDDRGLDFMREHGIVAELCVVSNLLTGALESIDDYKKLLDLFDQYGIRYTFSTDAPALQKTTLASEIGLLLHHGAASTQQVERSFATAAESSFLPPPSRAERRKSRWAGDVKAR